MRHLAITDHGNLFGVIPFYKKAVGSGIKPIIGTEVYLTSGSRFDKVSSKTPRELSHLILIARNEQGYKNLIEISTRSYTEGFYYKPRVDYELLQEYGEGLICLTSCLKGEVPKTILKGDMDEAGKVLSRYIDFFGCENVFLELQDHGIAEERIVIKGLVELSKKSGIPLVATNDIHFLKQDDYDIHDTLLCIQTGKKKKEKDRLRFSTDQVYFKSAEEMYQLFDEFPHACENTLRVAEMTELELKFDELHLPEFPVANGQTPQLCLRNLCEKGLNERFGDNINDAIKMRLEHELNIIDEMGFTSYFLIVADIVDYAKKNGIMVGPGRGSAAGSLVAYVTGITDINPIEYGLLFERFLNPERKGMPDIDIDFEDERRDEVIRYIINKYGSDSVAQIATFDTLGAKAAIRDVGRALDIPFGLVDRVAKMVPSGMSIRRAVKESADLGEIYSGDDELRNLLDVASSLEGLPRHISKHAAGVVIAPGRLSDYVPLMVDSKGEVATQYPKEVLEECGLLKMDILGLTTLSLIRLCLNMIRESHNVEIDISNLPVDDEKTYEMLSMGESDGVFQLESQGMKDLLKRVVPRSFKELVPIIGLYRPGPMGAGMIDDYIDRKHGRKKVEYLNPVLEEILSETYGVILYQEQVMHIASKVAGFSMAEADLIRRAMSKKSGPEFMESLKEDFEKGAKAQGIDKRDAEYIFEKVTPFAAYGFNKSHTTAYAVIAYQTAYLKANYPLEFMVSLLTIKSGDTDKVIYYINVAKRMGYEILQPDVNSSFAHFSIENGAIRYGLTAILNVGYSAVESIVSAREDGDFTGLTDFCCRVDLRLVNRKCIESLIKAGAMDCLGYTRSALLDALDTAIEYGHRRSSESKVAVASLLPEEDMERFNDVVREKEEFEQGEMLRYEKEVLGFYFSGHPMAQYKERLRGIITCQLGEIESIPAGSNVVVAGQIIIKRQITDKKGREMAFFTIEDETGYVECVSFASSYEKAEFFLTKGTVVVVSGRLEMNNGLKILVNEIIPVEEAERSMTNTLNIRVPRSFMESDENMESLYQFILSRTTTGGMIVRLYLERGSGDGEVVMQLPRSCSIIVDEETIGGLKKLVSGCEVWASRERINGKPTRGA